MSEHPPTADRPTGPGGSGHPEIDELASYVAGDIDAAGHSTVRSHLLDCAECSADAAALQHVEVELAALAAETMPADVAARLDAALERAASAPASATTILPGRDRRRSPGWATGAAAAAVVALLAAVAVGSLQGGANDNDAASTQAGAPAASTVGGIYASSTDYTKTDIKNQIVAVLRTAPREALGARAPAADAFAAASTAAAATSAPAMAAESATEASVAVAAPAESAAASSAAPAASASAAATGAKATADSATTAAASSAPALAASPAPDLTALRTDPARLARCVQLVTDGLELPLAYDFASFEGKPALAIVLPGPTPQQRDVYVVAGDCGEADDERLLHFERVTVG